MVVHVLDSVVVEPPVPPAGPTALGRAQTQAPEVTVPQLLLAEFCRRYGNGDPQTREMVAKAIAFTYDLCRTELSMEVSVCGK